MKKIATLFLSLCLAAGLFAQTANDALGIAQEYTEGTARSMAMGNAFTALGGDLGAIGINPASSGVMRYSQLTFTPSITTTQHNTDYLGRSASTRNTGLTVSNFGTVLSFDTGRYDGLLNYNFGFVYNKSNSFRSALRAEGTTAWKASNGRRSTWRRPAIPTLPPMPPGPASWPGTPTCWRRCPSWAASTPT